MNAKVAASADEVAEAIENEISYEFIHEFQQFRKDWWVFLLLGITLLLCGAVAICFPFFSAVSVTIVLGATLIVGGVALIVNSFWAGQWSGFFLQVLVGIFYIVMGMAIIDSPLQSVGILTLLLAAFFMVIGLVRIIVSLVERFPQWGWYLLNGIVTLLVGAIIYKSFPSSALWVIGLLVGIELFFHGWTWIMLSLAVRRLPAEDDTE